MEDGLHGLWTADTRPFWDELGHFFVFRSTNVRGIIWISIHYDPWYPNKKHIEYNGTMLGKLGGWCHWFADKINFTQVLDMKILFRWFIVNITFNILLYPNGYLYQPTVFYNFSWHLNVPTMVMLSIISYLFI